MFVASDQFDHEACILDMDGNNRSLQPNRQPL